LAFGRKPFPPNFLVKSEYVSALINRDTSPLAGMSKHDWHSLLYLPKERRLCERGKLLSYWLACAFSWHLDAFAAG
jgi:hypothetical protein